MNRRILLPSLAFAAAAALATATASAFVLNPAQLASNQVHTIFIDNDIVGAMSWTGPTPTFADFTNAADRAAQSWSQGARVNVAISINPTAGINVTLPACPPPWPPSPPVNCTNLIDATPSILHRPRAWFESSTTLAYTFCPGPATFDCDVVFYDGVSWEALDRNPDISGFRAAASLNRTLAHEMGHMLGLGDNPDSACATGTQSPLMCQASNGSNNGRRWDHPAPDDILGLRDSFAYSAVSRSVGVLRGDIGAAAAITWGEDALSSGFSSIQRPRLSCQTSGNVPDCVVVTAGDAVTFRTLTLDNGMWNVSSTHTMGNTSVHEVDVAFGGNPGAHAVAVRLDSSADRRVWWARWGLSGDTIQGALVDASNNFVETHEPPRVSWHRTLPGGGRYVIAFTDPARRVRIAVSNDSSGVGFGAAQVATYTTAERRAFGPLDLSCPTHQTGQTTCRIVLNDITENANPSENHLGLTVHQHNRAMHQQACLFTIDPNTFLPGPLTCSVTDVTSVNATSLADFSRPSAPPGQPLGPGWLLAGSQTFPVTTLNTRTHFDFATVTPFRNPLSDQVQTFDTPLGAGQPPFSFWGGVSCDWVEFAQRFLCVQLTQPVRF